MNEGDDHDDVGKGPRGAEANQTVETLSAEEAVKPPATCATFPMPISVRAFAPSAERLPEAQ